MPRQRQARPARHHWPDEEPDFDEIADEREFDDQERVEHHLGMDRNCTRCGVEGHDGKDCPTVTPDLLRPEKLGDRPKRRQKAR